MHGFHTPAREDRYLLSPPFASLVQLDRTPGYEPVRLGVRISRDAPFIRSISMSDGGKGSSPRPFSIANDEYSKRWDAIFSRDLKEEVPDDKKSDTLDASKQDLDKK
jgi:hypothetical protein